MNMKILHLIILLTSLLISDICPQGEKPIKLVVGIVVDQMRFVDLYRYYDFYGDDGFKKLLKEGTNFTSAHFNYELTSTGPGHASIYTGTTPYYHGIIGNDFYDRRNKKMINCVQDDSQESVGSNDEQGRKSPVNLFATTITDQLKLFTNKKSKVFSISIKDRGAILPAGHMADGAFWFNTKTGDFISSSFYLNELPEWIKKFNRNRLPDKYLSQNLNLLLDEKYYRINPSDESPYEEDELYSGRTSFPYSFNNVPSDRKYVVFQYTPYANQILVDLAKEVIINEKLSKSDVPDFLAISFSTTDILSHSYGNYSYEAMDIFLRLDRQLADLLNFLDETIGKENYILFLTSDHAGIETPGYLKENKIPTGGIGTSRLTDSLKAFATRTFGSPDIIENYSNRQIYFDYVFIKENKLNKKFVEDEFRYYLRENFPEIQSILGRDFLETKIASRVPEHYLINGWNPIMSGDIFFNLRPQYQNNFLEKGTTHGSSYSYDTHIPLIFYGNKVQAKTINDPVFIVDIAATIANILKINTPSACIGRAILPE